MGEALGGMRVALLLAVFLVYLVMASQFESIIQPLVILLTVPLALVGAAFALDLTGTPISVVVLIGGIVLAGIVVNNAIVLIDYTNLLRSRGKGVDEALLEAGPVRLRPILMTAFSTIAGMLPIAIGLGAGAETRAPMGTCVVGGMITSTLLTLVVVPVVYSLMEQVAGWFKRLVGLGAGPMVVAEAESPST